MKLIDSMNPRWKQLAELLVNYSTGIQPGERVMIAFSELETYPLALAVYGSCIKAGGFPQVQFLSEDLNRQMLKFGTLEQISWVPEIEAFGMEWAQVYFGLRGAANLDTLWDISTEKLAAFRKAIGKISTLRWEKTRWCLVRVPNRSLAQQAGMDEETLTEIFFEACFLDWPQIAQQWGQWAEQLNRGKSVRVLGKETDLTFSIVGRKWLVGDGHTNMPDGEIATAPVENTVNGYISFEFPAVLGGRLVEKIRLAWSEGKLIEASAAVNEGFLQAVLQTDAGASKIGEFAIGTNPALSIFCKDILLDEKIGGTIHVALGRAYPGAGGTNQSAIHWDMIKDMRQEGQIYLDGQLIFENGQILLR